MRSVSAELESVRSTSADGRLHAEAVVEFAKNPATALHARFDWDDGEAATKWRLKQAGDLIRVQVQRLPESTRTAKVYVALDEDRKDGGGYRSLADVMSDPSRRESLLAQARRDAEHFAKKYEELDELSPVLGAMATFLGASEPEAAA